MKKLIILAFFALATMLVHASEGSPRLLILQANTHGNDNGGAGGFATSLVELFNNTDTIIDLDAGNYFLHIGNSTQWTNVIQLQGVIPAQSSFLIVSDNPQNFTPRAELPEPDQVAEFTLVNNGFKVAVLREISLLGVNNPFADTSLVLYYVDMLGVEGSSGFEGQAAQQSRPQGPRRTSLLDTDNNRADFSQADFRGELLGNSRTPDTLLYRIWPRNSSAPWDPITGLPAIHPVPYPHLTPPECPIDWDMVENSNLPIIFINTDCGRFVPDRETWLNMTFAMAYRDNPDYNIYAIRAGRGIRGRGNYTFVYGRDSNPYRMRFRNNIQSFFGLPAAENWALLRGHRFGGDQVGFELGRRLGLECSPSTHHVRVVFNGHDQGLYMLTEHRQAAPSYITESNVPGRPLIAEDGGWFVHIDRRFDEDPRFRTTHFDLPIMIQDPGRAGLADGEIPEYVDNHVRNDWNRLTELMYDASFPENEWRDLIYMDSWVRYFMVQNVIRHRYLSTYGWDGANIFGQIADLYVHKDRYKRISAGPLWDLDNSLVWVEEGYMPPNHTWQRVYTARREQWLPRSLDWFSRFFEDPVFIARWKEIWNQNIGGISTMPSFLDSIATLVGVDFSDRVQFLEERIPFLDSVYNTVSILPTDSPVDFSSASHNFTPTAAIISPQTFTLIAYGEMLNLDAVFQNADTSAFEITYALTQTPTGRGGYLATITVMPRMPLLMGQTLTDTLILSGTNQDNPFLFEIPLELTTVSFEDVAVLQAYIDSLANVISGLQADTAELHQIIMEWFELTYDLLDTIDWLRQLLAECEGNATDVVETLHTTPLQVFPNPVTDQLHIIHDWQLGDVVELFDMRGLRVFSQPVGAGSARPDGDTITIDMSPFPRGNYILRVGKRVAKIVRR